MDQVTGPDEGAERQELLARYGIKPQEAAAWLGHLGYTENIGMNYLVRKGLITKCVDS